MATFTTAQSFGATETVTNTKLHNLVESASIHNVVDADISASANIADTKLADITSGGKVRGTSLLNLSSIPSGAGQIPFVNMPNGLTALPLGASLVSLVTIPNQSLLPINLASWVDGISLRNLASIPTVSGLFNYKTIVSSLASGSLPQYDGVNNFIGKVPDPQLTNLAFSAATMDASTYSVDAYGVLVNDSLTGAATSITAVYWAVKDSTERSVCELKYKKISGINTVTCYVMAWASGVGGGGSMVLKVSIGSVSGSTTEALSTTPTWYSFTVDVSTLSNGTTYDVNLLLKETTATNSCNACSIVGINS